MTDAPLLESRLVVVSGRVQGVFFRASTARQAAKLGITGWAHNVPDGTVQVLVCGKPDAVEQLLAWLWQGPDEASVTGVEISSTELGPPESFTVG